MKTISLPDGRTLTYELTRKSVRNINFRPKEDGVVYVSANTRVRVGEIEGFLRERADFFFSAFERLRERERKNRVDIEKTAWLGREYPVRVIQNSRETAVFDETECRVFTRLFDDPEHILTLIGRALDSRFLALCRELNDEVRAELSAFGLEPPPTRITVKDMKSRWGSCSYERGHISISKRLCAYPREAVKSVFWHEYAHYYHHDHSKRFYAFLDKYCPCYREWHRLLSDAEGV